MVSGDNALMSVPMTIDGATVDPGTPMRLFDYRPIAGTGRTFSYAPSADGQKFLALQDDDAEGQRPVTIWMNWMTGLGR